MAVVIQHLADESLFDVVHGYVEDERRRAVLQHLRRCPSCERRFREVVRDRERARIQAQPLPSPRSRALVVGASAAAAAILLVTAGILMLSQRSPGIPIDWLPTASTEVFLRDATPCADQGSAAVAAYRAHDAARVVSLLHGRELPAKCDPMKLLLASALVHRGDPAAALQVLDALDVESLPQPARDRGRWTQAAALDRLERHGAADDILRDLASRSGEYRDRATGLLAERR